MGQLVSEVALMASQSDHGSAKEEPLVEADELLSVSQAARILKAHPNSVRHWADLGLLPAFRIGRRGDRRFKPADVTNFLVSWKKDRPAEPGPDTDGAGPESGPAEDRR